jgi:beta-glucosidase
MAPTQILSLAATFLFTISLSRTSQTPDSILKSMTLEDKLMMLRGTFGNYVGDIAKNDRLGIPYVGIQDGPQGFRVTQKTGAPGSTTCWPSSINIAAAWDEDLMYLWANAMAKEFHKKGANVHLGPGLGIARAPTGGRIFEYLCGEEPRLCSQLVGPLIRGMHAEKVMATAKVNILFADM